MSSVAEPTLRTPEQISEVMRRVPSARTEPELSFHRALRRAGIRSFRVCAPELPGKPDIILPSKRLAIFIDGDFWHGHQYEQRGHASLDSQLTGVHNQTYWMDKIRRNVDRDFRNTNLLLAAGWKVLRFWESDVRKEVDRCVRIAIAATGARPTKKAAFSALPKKSVIEMFAGIGLVRLALQERDWRVVFANDNDPQKLEMYSENFGAEHYRTESIRDLKGTDLPDGALLTASFPCNDLSVAGARNGLSGNQSSTFWELIRLLCEMGGRKPPLILLENVFGFLTSHGGKDFETALKALTELGYSCDPFVVDAARFAPQSRVRLFVVAQQRPANSDSTAGLSESSLRPKQLVTFIREHPEIGWNIRRLPDLPHRSKSLQDILEALPDNDPHWWNSERCEYFFNQLSPRHRRLAEAMISDPDFSYASAFRRIRQERSMAELRVDGIAGCLRTPRGGSGRQILFRAGKGKFSVRLLTARECARLQGVPDNKFKISAPLNQALFGFGDAVCVPVVEWIVENYLEPAASELMRGRLLTPAKMSPAI